VCVHVCHGARVRAVTLSFPVSPTLFFPASPTLSFPTLPLPRPLAPSPALSHPALYRQVGEATLINVVAHIITTHYYYTYYDYIILLSSM